MESKYDKICDSLWLYVALVSATNTEVGSHARFMLLPKIISHTAIRRWEVFRARRHD